LSPLDLSAGARRVSEYVSSTATPPKAPSGRTAASDIETEGIMTTKPRNGALRRFPACNDAIVAAASLHLQGFDLHRRRR